jgi:hypothetical protein
MMMAKRMGTEFELQLCRDLALLWRRDLAKLYRDLRKKDPRLARLLFKRAAWAVSQFESELCGYGSSTSDLSRNDECQPSHF